MSYVIEPMAINSFLDDKTIKYPRFQRKRAWKPSQNFELCVSIFQEYPCGVVILNNEQKVSWLLDGRQRRSALSQMRDNPITFYEWAKSYIKFDRKDEAPDVARAYWDIIDKYLEQGSSEEKNIDNDDDDRTSEEASKEDYDENDDEEVRDNVAEEPKEEKSFVPERQRKGLKTLLDLILMVHPLSKKHGSSWQHVFDFTKFFSKLQYAPAKLGNQVEPVRLRKFLLDLSNTLDHDYDGKWGQKEFVDYYMEAFDVLPDKKAAQNFERAVEGSWDKITQSIETIKNVEKIFSDMRIGVVRLTNVLPLDAQNIFSRVNKGGTPLKAEELLSAKPYWNKPVQNIDQKTEERIQDLYRKMQIPVPDDFVRWDIAATLVERINDGGLIFAPQPDKDKDNEIQLDRIAMGFKLLSAIHVKGISNKSVIELESCDHINWDDGLHDLVEELNLVVEIIREDDFFGYIHSYGMPLCKLLGNAPAMEFLTILWINWKVSGCPRSGKKMRAIQRDARLLFDRLTFEYSVRLWRGSSDSKLARDVTDWNGRLEQIPESSWLQLISESCEGMYNGQSIKYSNLKPILVYAMALEAKGYPERNCPFDVDHIIPQSAFNGNSSLIIKKDGLANLCVIPRVENEKKGEKPLSALKGKWLGEKLSFFTGISQDEFDEFSSVMSIDRLIEKRKKTFITIFTDLRKKSLLA
ncbi:MAG: DUF262 domain-containing protein [Akkermansia sp.]|nr:DUF262 domain-containing protein [Akkermansia sp.]